MGDRHLTIVSRQGTHHRGRRVALHDHAIGTLGVHHLAKRGQQSRGQPVERLAGLHQVEVDVRLQICDRQHLIQQPAVLRRHAGAHVEPDDVAQRRNDGEQLDRFGPRAEDHQDFFHRPAPSTAILPPR